MDFDALQRSFAGKTVLITGASRGIGAQAAKLAAKAGAHVLITARSEDALAEVAAAIVGEGGVATVYACDLSDEAEVDRLADRVLDEHGGVDVVIHNAARSIRRSIADSTDRMHDFRRTMALNYFAPVQLTLRLLDSLRSRGGSVCMVLTMGVLIPGPYFAAYLASKAALGAFADSLAAEFRHDGMHVASVYLPLVKTEMMAPTKAYKGVKGIWTAGKAGYLVLESIANRRRRVITRSGAYFGFSNLFRPGRVTRVLNVLHQTFPIEGESRYPRLKRVIEKALGGAPL